MIPSSSNHHQPAKVVHDGPVGVGSNVNVVRRLYIASVLCGIFLILEVVGGWWAST
jgi:Co/Zn/Cd efflux system component